MKGGIISIMNKNILLIEVLYLGYSSFKSFISGGIKKISSSSINIVLIKVLY